MLESKPLNLVDYVSAEFSPVADFPAARKAAYDWLVSGEGVEVWDDWDAAANRFGPIALQFGLYSALRGLPPECAQLADGCNAWVDYDAEDGPIGHFDLPTPQLLYKDNYAAFVHVVSAAHLLTGLDFFEFEYRTALDTQIRTCTYDRDTFQWFFVDHK